MFRIVFINKAFYTQFFLYLVVGGMSCIVDIAFFLLFTTHSVFSPILASSLSFFIATIVNYFLSRTWVFKPKRESAFLQWIKLFLVAFVGLGINCLFFGFLVYTVHSPLLFAKCVAIGTAFLWNFLGRKLLVYSKEMPDTTINLLSRISSMQAKIPSKSLLFVILAFISTSFLRLLYIFTYPLSYIGDGSVYYSMILKQKSHLLQASGYPWLIMKPYHFLKNWVLHRSELPSNPNWWEPYDRWQTPIKGVFSWTEVFQDHPFILFQHCIEISSIILGYCLIKKYFGRIIGALFVFFYALSPLSLEGPSTTFPEWFQAVFVIYWFFFAEKASQVTGSKKYWLYTLLGGITACGVLIKFNSLPLFIMLFLGLLLIGNWKKSIRPCLFSIGSFSVIIFYFLFSFHEPIRINL